MAFSSTLQERGVDGNVPYKTYKLTDVQTNGSSIVYTGFKKVLFVSAVNQTDIADTFRPAWNAYSGGNVTLTASTADDDGVMTVWGLN